MLLSEALADLKASYLAVQSENVQRQAIMETPEYKALKEKMDAMLAVVPDSSDEYAADLAATLKFMNENGIHKAEGFVVKTRATRSVDVLAVLRAMGGDIDNLMLVTNVTQKSLEKFIKDNPGYKADLRACIKDEGVKVVDVAPQTV
jgi:hypothetical protein